MQSDHRDDDTGSVDQKPSDRFAPDRFATGTLLGGKLRIIRRLGFGGMGAVYEVEHELTHHRRALKLLHAHAARIPTVVERFLREASAAGRIGNAHIVETFDAGRLDSGEPYIVMELLQGKTLSEVLIEQGPLPIDATCDILIQACDAVSAAHAVGIVHRDLKPENLFLTGPALSFVKILDFGVSKFDVATTGEHGLTLEGSPIGTPYYMSPEQVRGERSLDGRADIYALGVLLYECLTGRKPFVADTLPHLAVLIHQGKYPTPSEVRQGLPAAVDLVVSRAMASERADRYESAAEFSRAIARLRDSISPIALSPTQLGNPGSLASASTPLHDASSRAPAGGRVTRPWFIVAAVGALLVVSGLTIALRERSASDRTQGLTSDAKNPIPDASALASASSSTSPPSKLSPSSAPEAPARTEEIDATSAIGNSSVEPAASVIASARPGPARPHSGPASSSNRVPAAGSPGTSIPRSRASSYGLSQDNPFK
ncbi:MAG TPA: serine/threonine-protein kinase [Polyangiaceae bacterium]|nr:serine/threonine-protein kinase [Polyangiaceae bacterium]